MFRREWWVSRSHTHRQRGRSPKPRHDAVDLAESLLCPVYAKLVRWNPLCHLHNDGAKLKTSIEVFQYVREGRPDPGIVERTIPQGALWMRQPKTKRKLP